VPASVDVAKVRRRLGLSQAVFARTFGLDVTALHAWEQGRRRPDRAARVLLAVISKEPQAVLRALAGRQGLTKARGQAGAEKSSTLSHGSFGRSIVE
jgi:transcriptional regulator with XRE-family HTH domain